MEYRNIVESFLNREDMFDCETHKARIPARTCIARQALDDDMSACYKCRQGKNIKKQFGKDIKAQVVPGSVFGKKTRRVVVQETVAKGNKFSLTPEQVQVRLASARAANSMAWSLYRAHKSKKLFTLEEALDAVFLNHQDLKEALFAAADENVRTPAGEIVYRLKQTFAKGE